MPVSVRARQLELVEQPWRMLLVCSALNLTSWRQVDPVMERFFAKWPDPRTFLQSTHDEVVEVIRPLGLYNRRAQTWRKLTLIWFGLSNPTHKEVAKLPGVGQYALDSWRIFIEQDLTVEPDDKVLRAWIQEARCTKNPFDLTR